MDENSYHYGVIERAIAEIDRAEGRLSLEDLAARLDMSAPHFQRTFSAWVGVSPKRYQQYLTLGHARDLLRARHTVMQTTLSTGLSGTARLHDLFIRWEAMTPGDFAQGGAGLAIHELWTDSPFGEALVMGTDRGICGIAFAAEVGRGATQADMRSRWPNATFTQGSNQLRGWADAAFAMSGDVPLHLGGRPLQIKVWEALMAIPSGRVSTYSDLARAAGNPRAVRAAASAVGRNPVSWIIPCHRALRKSGQMGGYHWGVPVKRAMLAFESARFDAATLSP